MIPRRIWINLAAFALLFFLLLSWAVRNVISLDAIDRPYRVTASFESSPGLQTNVAVTYLGVQIGTIDRVQLVDGTVLVDLDIERGRRVPEGVHAAIRRKSAVGEPYVSLEMPAGYTGGADPIDPDDDYHIPIGSTSVPLSYAELFSSVDALVASIPAPELATVIHELAVGLEGRGADLRRTIEGISDGTATLAERSDVLDRLAGELTQLTASIAGQQDAIGTSLDNLSALADTLAASRADIEALLAETPGLATQVADLIDGLYPNLTCTFTAAGGVLANAGTEENIANLLAVLALAPAARQSFESAIVQPGEDGADGYYLGGSFTLGVGAQPPAYATPATLPPSPPLRTCDAGPGPDPGTAPDGSVAGDGPGGTNSPDDEAAVSDRPVTEQPAVPATTDAEGGDQSFPLGTVLLALGLALALVLLAAYKPWRLLLAGGRDDGGPDPDRPDQEPPTS
jgi:phospholipid/cholesterol/gamma-HCH transport system substrate-binding protein